MAAWRRAIELSLGDADVERLRSIAQSRTEPASRVERARILLAYREDPSFFAVGRALSLHHQTVQRCVERAMVEGLMAALDDRPRPEGATVTRDRPLAAMLSLILICQIAGAVSVTASLFFLISTFPAAALVGGAPEADQSIARHVVMVTGSDRTFCSGVVIAQDLILTAAQCVHPATSYRIIGFDAPKPLTPKALKSVSSTVVHPEWDADAILRHRVSADVALVKLAAPLPPAYMPVALADSQRVVAAGARVIVVGYGVTVIGNGRTGGTLRAAHLLVTGNPGTLQIRLADPNTKGELAGLGACQGDSGGPVLDTSDGRLAVIGMISWSTGPALSTGCGGLTGVTPIIRYREWIVKTAAAMGSALKPMAPPEPSPKPGSEP